MKRRKQWIESLDCHEQCSRRNCLRIYGVKEINKENGHKGAIKIVEKEMQEKG